MGDGINGLGSPRDPAQDLQIQKHVDEQQVAAPRDQVPEVSERKAFVKSDPRTLLRQVVKTDSNAGYGRKHGCALPGG